jgi:SAM-dependent MidA family methyltransferase
MRRASLRERLGARIAREGPITIADYMHACLHDPSDGYYAVRPALGEAGDFITAPHVSQMFGELIGLWAAEVWVRLGRPPRVRLIEFGPGDGTLIGDALRAARAQSGFLEAAEVVLVETSAPLRARQATALANFRPRWIERPQDIGDDLPVILVANEFLDCLPIRQAVRCADGWRERRVAAGGFEAGEPVRVGVEAPIGAIYEWSPALVAMGEAVGALVARAGGAALFIDYGRDRAEFGDTLQAVRGHTKEDPLDNPGLADLTAHVDFPAFLAAAGSRWPILSQGEFLSRLGIAARAVALVRANPRDANKIERQLARLTAPDQMGELFKAVCVAAPGLTPPGFG